MAGLNGFTSYNFDIDERWIIYRRNIEIPPGRNEEQVLPKYKAKWYKREVDPEFDVASVLARTSPAEQPSAHTTTPGQNGTANSPSQKNSEANKAQSGSFFSRFFNGRFSPSGTGTSTASTGGTRVSGSDVSNSGLLAVLHLLMVVCIPVYLQPFHRKLSYLAYVQFLQAAIAAHIFKVYKKFGLPKFKPFPGALTDYLGRASMSSDFQYAMQCLLFMSHPPMSMALVSPLILAAYFLAVYGRNNYSSTALWKQYGARGYSYLQQNKEQSMYHCATSEIMLGFALIMSMLSPSRSFLLLFGYWSMLKIRYFAPDFSTYHYRVWYMIDEKVRPILNAVPMLNVPINIVKKWFLNIGAAR